MSFASVGAQMLALFLAILVGLIARKADVMNDSVDGAVSRLVMDVTLPCMIVASVFSEGPLPSPSAILTILGASCAAYALIILVSAIYPILMRTPKPDRGVYSFMAAFGNVGFIGFPVLAAIFGPQAVLYGAIANIPFNLAVFTIGAAFIAGGDNPLKSIARNWRSLVSPTQAASLVAILLVLLRIEDGGVIGEALGTVGNMTTPAALLIVGSSLAKYSPKAMLTNWRAYIAAAFRLFVMPLLVHFVLGSFVSNELVLGVLTVTSGMPVATIGMLLCLKHDGNLKAMTQGTFISTASSVLTIPVIAMLVL